MAPGPQESVISLDKNMETPSIDGESVVISGMSGLFPLSNNVQEFADNLYNKVNMVTDDTRYKFNHSEVQNYSGTVPDLENFDAQFFGVHYRLTMTMDPMAKKLLEHTYQAVYDAGINPEVLRGSKTGVFTGSCFSEAEKAFFYVAAQRNGHGIVGCCKAMFANRISYWLDSKGPSMSIDSLCASSLIALQCAVQAMRRGDCDAAVVAGANLCLHPQSSILYGRAMPMSSDGKTRSFDRNADGLVRSEAVNVIFLQKAKDAKRIYAEVCHVKSKFTAIAGENSSQNYGPYRPVEVIRNFFHECYDDIGIDPRQVEYVEAFGTAIPEAEKNQLEAIGQVFCKDRSDPLLIGSVMSNMGYSEAASGVSSIVKICLGYHTGKLAGNLHYENHHDVQGIQDGRMRIISDNTDFYRTYAAINNFSISGTNVHALLKGYWKQKNPNCYLTSLPYLVGVSARQESGVIKILENLKLRPVDAEEIALLHSIHVKNISGHLARGYTILSKNEIGETEVLAENCEYFADVKRPLWFVYSGMGSQWATMGTALFKIPIFAAAIERCNKVLKPRGVDIVEILRNPDTRTFDNILNSFVGIAAVQIGLTDILNALGIKPDFIIGHSVGELGCAYADGCFTAEEMILSAYSRGLVSVQTPFIRGSMAAVGVGFKAISDMCPPEIEVACHNGPDSSTISGPADVMKDFVAELTARGIFAKEVPCSNIAYHSKYIAEAGPALRKYLSEVIKEPKLRSEKWVSTSVPQDKWHKTVAKYSSAEYHTNNLLNPVLFEETAHLIPENAVCIEIAPHGLLQAILKRSLGENCTNIPLTRRGASDPVAFLLNAVGELYKLGFNPKIQELYPKIEYPVSTGTPMLSHLVEWIHSEHWPLAIYAAANRQHAAERHFVMSVQDDEYRYIEGHVVEDKIIFPLSAILVVVWETLAMVWREKQRYLGVQFHDVYYHRDAVLRHDQPLELAVTIQRGSGRFEVTHDNFLIVSGTITRVKQSLFAKHHVQFGTTSADTKTLILNNDDIYKMLSKKGYGYKGEFRGLQKSNLDLTHAQIPWNGNWVSLIDNMLQLGVLRRNHAGISKPKFIRQLTIDTKTHEQTIVKDAEGNADIFVDGDSNLIKCGGIIIKDVDFIDLPLNEEKSNVMKKIHFLPYYPTGCVDVSTVLHSYLQIIAENVDEKVITSIELSEENDLNNLSGVLSRIFEELPLKVNLVTKYLNTLNKSQMNEIKLVIGNNILNNNNKVTEDWLQNLVKDTFVISVEETPSFQSDKPYKIVATANTQCGSIVLARWCPIREKHNTICVTVEQDLSFLEQVRENLTAMDKLLIITNYPPKDGLKELVKEWRGDNEKNKVYLVMSDKQSISDDQFVHVLESQLAFNVFVNDVWGNYFFLPIEDYKTNQNLKLVIARPGDLDSLRWAEALIPNNNGIHVKVCYAGPSISDVQRSSGFIQFKNIGEEPSFGMDFSGIRLGSNEKVMGIIREGAISHIVESDPDLLWPVPEHWSLEDAATVPLPYAHALYCFGIKSKPLAGNRVLIHDGTEALGQAAISVALNIGCEVFTTVSDTRNMSFIKRLFPQLQDDHIGTSRDTTFEIMVNGITMGKGCSLVLNTLKGELREASTRCVGSEGAILDVTVKDALQNSSLGMDYLSLKRQYIPVIFSNIFKIEDSTQKKLLQRMLSEGIAKGFVRPLSRVVYDPDEVTKAFRLISSCRHRGRSLIQMEDLNTLPVTPRLSCSSNATYVVVCGKEDFGIEIVDRLVERGAKNIIIHCDSENNKGYLFKKLELWNNKGVFIKVTTYSLFDNNNAIVLLNDANGMGPVGGIFIVTGTYNTGDEKLTMEILDHASRKVCLNLKYFAVIQRNTSDVKAHIKKIMLDRTRSGNPSTLLLLPTLVQFKPNASKANKDDAKPVTEHAALNALENCLRLENSVVVSYNVRDSNDVNVVDEVLKVLGTTKEATNKIPQHVTLQQLGADYELSDIIAKMLYDNHHLLFNKHDILNLSLAELKEIEQKVLKNKDKKGCKGLEVFYTRVDPDELQATVDMVLMPTFIHNSTQRNDEFNSAETYLTIVPGLEGHYGMFQRLCQRLKLPAVVLQPPLEQPHISVQEIAQRFVKTMKTNMDLNGKKFYLMGYSFGVAIAMEMAVLLEEYGHEGVIYCIDSSPQFFKQQLDHYLGDMSKNELQNAVIEHVFSLLTNQALKDELKETLTWEEKVNICIRNLCRNVAISAQYAKSIIEAAYARIDVARNYKPTLKKLRSQIVFLKAQNTIADSNDYGLSKLCYKDVIIYDLDSDHANAPQDLKCSNIVNRYLEDYLIDRFLTTNLCETYLINAAIFMDSSVPNEEKLENEENN